MCDKSVDTFPFVFHPVPNQFKTQKNVWYSFFGRFFYAKILPW